MQHTHRRACGETSALSPSRICSRAWTAHPAGSCHDFGRPRFVWIVTVWIPCSMVSSESPFYLLLRSRALPHAVAAHLPGVAGVVLDAVPFDAGMIVLPARSRLRLGL